jgi:hypothetical protein
MDDEVLGVVPGRTLFGYIVVATVFATPVDAEATDVTFVEELDDVGVEAVVAAAAPVPDA